MFTRSSGVLMHISSLPGEYGIGTFGKEAFSFIDFLAEVGCTYWQTLPFGPTDAFNSPYASVSAFAGNMNFIDLEQLKQVGLLTQEELTENKYANPYTCAFDFLYRTRINTLYKAFTRLPESAMRDVRQFAEENKEWLDDFALYTVLKEANCGEEWYNWEDSLKFRDPDAIAQQRKTHKASIDFLVFIQYLFYTQWKRVKAYAEKRGIKIVGDLPIYISMESPDVWGNLTQFDLDDSGKPKCVAGVPPDYFCQDGQKWGNALYRWSVMKADGYDWWMRRLKASFDLFDVVRIDHFRAFSSYWAVPVDAPTAKEGKWMKGPGMDFFDQVFARFGDSKIIAEDLGLIDDGVRKLLDDTGLPGMRVMQFGFIDPSDNIHLPHRYAPNTFAYTGTHDNNTILGWLWEAPPEARNWALDYCGFSGSNWADGGYHSASCRSMIRTLWQSPAQVVIVPIQDLCGFGGDTKMNLPGVPNGNWAFRISAEQLGQIDRKWLKRLNQTYRRTVMR